jgi:hypothetical protein
MKQKFFFQWKMVGYAAFALVVAWGLMMIFVYEEPAAGRVLLMIAGIGMFSTILFNMLDKHIRSKK